MAVARVVLSVVALLSAAAYTGAATNCKSSTLKESEVEGAVSLINEARTKVYQGEQPNGESGENLPPAVSVTTVEWDCDLEAEALKDIQDNCNKKSYSIYRNISYYRRDDISKVHLKRTITFFLTAIDYTTLTNITGSPKFNNDPDLVLYLNVIRDKTSKIGCARYTCNPKVARPTYTTLCITNQPSLKTGDVVYEADTSYACPRKSYMSTVARKAFLNKHNDLRSQFILGSATKPGNYKLVYDCELEKAAYERAMLCENFTAEDRRIFKENSFNFTNDLTRSLEEYANSAMLSWWSELKASSAIASVYNVVYPRQGISNFVKIASDLTTKVGCGIYNCTNMINVVCRYETGLAYSFRFYDPISIDAIRNKYCKECGNNCEDGLCPVA